MSMGHTYKFFDFYISYTILTLPLSIFHLSFMEIKFLKEDEIKISTLKNLKMLSNLGVKKKKL